MTRKSSRPGIRAVMCTLLAGCLSAGNAAPPESGSNEQNVTFLFYPDVVLPELEDEFIESSSWQISGFAELFYGERIHDDKFEKNASISEARIQVRVEGATEKLSGVIAADFIYDDVTEHTSSNLEKGHGPVDLREANLSFSPLAALDFKAGRQILTWGTGDLLFINDLFPKDFTSFFIGRDPEYLKAPSDAIKLSAFFESVSLDLVYTPRFDADRFVDGSRLSYYNPLLGRIAGRDAVIKADQPSDWFTNDEIALRIYSNLNGLELAGYAYNGYWKSPEGISPSGRPTFPSLSVYGGSIVGQFAGGISNAEFGYYDSREDSSGNNPLVRNSEVRFMVGYKRELWRDTTLGLQYYLEHMLDHDEYKKALPAGIPEADENRHVVTLRLTQLLLNQDLQLGFFSFYSPSDKDGYVRTSATYKLDDKWRVEGGGNFFKGEDDYTMFSQLHDNSNIYTGIRYSY